ncbi:LysM peptidoglycan-binding domain-containing protein [Commensalibacter oyaizuii]|uniref:LysM peptidoglycan-binding domain-containing protein n=1 Tax=Commensalibacter oyaizuii TaxID=3043873 RepID=A0ABT6Q3J0_9PROT|nr:LysM peptidoglycan-binding domain-containing protein [Commensalibacter sp. TBRC 16381]MDI2091680.1 LysM peptidoglycan-binding domain-containing protein [Commensalibacter sp. TBRC 16381]
MSYYATVPLSWQTTIDRTSIAWDEYDDDIRNIVNQFNQHLRSTPEYHDLDWRLIKAMIWVETGQHSSQWHFKPMQIGNNGDNGLKAVINIRKIKQKNGKNKIVSDGAELIIPPAFAQDLTYKNKAEIQKNPQLNIKAGIAYLLLRHAKFKYRTRLDVDQQLYVVQVKRGDTLTQIAKDKLTTIGILQSLNRGVRTRYLQSGTWLIYRKASIQRYICGWHSITFASIAKRYNVKGDLYYAKKLQYIFQKFKYITYGG